eukprot:2910547-Alexandrium_andersonii.AAC.1
MPQPCPRGMQRPGKASLETLHPPRSAQPFEPQAPSRVGRRRHRPAPDGADRHQWEGGALASPFGCAPQDPKARLHSP